MDNKDKDLDRFVSELDALTPDDLEGDTFHGHTLDAGKWGLYQKIVKELCELPDRCRSVLAVDYFDEPYPAEKFAKVTVTLPQAVSMEGDGKNSLAAAAVLCDHLSFTNFGGKIRINFLVNNVWAD